jgi:hypothetical protein
VKWLDSTGTPWVTRVELPSILGRPRSTAYGWVKAGIIPLVRNPVECGSWHTYDAQWLTVPTSAISAVQSFEAAVVNSKCAQAALARAARLLSVCSSTAKPRHL